MLPKLAWLRLLWISSLLMPACWGFAQTLGRLYAMLNYIGSVGTWNADYGLVAMIVGVISIGVAEILHTASATQLGQASLAIVVTILVIVIVSEQFYPLVQINEYTCSSTMCERESALPRSKEREQPLGGSMCSIQRNTCLTHDSVVVPLGSNAVF